MGTFVEDAAAILQSAGLEDHSSFISERLGIRSLWRQVDDTIWWIVADVAQQRGDEHGTVQLGLRLDPSAGRYGVLFRIRSLETLRLRLPGILADLRSRALSGKGVQCSQCGGRMKLHLDAANGPFLGCDRFPSCKGKIEGGVVEVK